MSPAALKETLDKVSWGGEEGRGLGEVINNCLIAKPPSNFKPFTHSYGLPKLGWLGEIKGREREGERREDSCFCFGRKKAF